MTLAGAPQGLVGECVHRIDDSMNLLVAEMRSTGEGETPHGMLLGRSQAHRVPTQSCQGRLSVRGNGVVDERLDASGGKVLLKVIALR